MSNFFYRLCSYLRSKRKYQVAIITQIAHHKKLVFVNVEAHCKMEAKKIAKTTLVQSIKIDPIAVKSNGKVNQFIQQNTMPQ